MPTVSKPITYLIPLYYRLLEHGWKIIRKPRYYDGRYVFQKGRYWYIVDFRRKAALLMPAI